MIPEVGPDVSVVIPAGSVDKGLVQQLRAVAAQSCEEPFEVVVALNSAEVDAVRELAEVLDRIVTEFDGSRVRSVVAADRRSAAYARNCGATAATGSRLVFCDSDDIVRAGWLAALLERLTTSGAVGGRLVEFSDDGEVPSWRPPATPGGLPTFLGHPYLVSASMAIHRGDFFEVGGFDESLTRGEDIALSWRLIKAGHHLAYAADAVVDYRVRGSITQMVRQHYLYGIGMSQVLLREGVPGSEASGRPSGLLRPNNQPGGLRSPVGLLRKAALGAGRLVGILQDRLKRRSARADSQKNH
jgi:glycosyltransferase involved in cell wall biosynthesis